MNSPFDTSAQQFYIHSSNPQIYYKVYLFLEDWIANNIFRENKDRVFLASNAYAFRRRFEITDMSTDYNDLQPSALDFPFANYWPMNSGWQVHTNFAGNPAFALYEGISVGNTQIKVSLVKNIIPATFYFDREDDARFAFDLLHFFTFNDHYDSFSISYMGNEVRLPIAIKVTSLKFNPSYNESDWLKKNRIFTITCDFEIRTYITKPPKQPKYNIHIGPNNTLEDENGPIKDIDGNDVFYNDGGISYPITKEVILNPGLYSMITVTGDIEEVHVNIDKIEFKDPEDPLESNDKTLEWIAEYDTIKNGEIYVWDKDSPNIISSLKYLLNGSPIPTIIPIPDITNPYIDIFNKNEDLNIYDDENHQHQIGTKIFKNGKYIGIKIPGNTERPLFIGVPEYFPNEKKPIRVPFSYNIPNLMGNSDYDIYLDFSTKGGSNKKLFSRFTTKDPYNPNQDITTGNNALVGLKW